MASEDRLEAARNQLATAIGHALSEWTKVEMSMTYVFTSVMDTSSIPVTQGLILWANEEPGRRMAHTVINAIIGFDARADVITATIAESDLASELKAFWPAIAQRLKKKYKKRHEIAHFMISNIEQEDGSWVAMVTPFATSVGSYSEKRLSANDVIIRKDTFRELGETLAWFRSQVECQRGRNTAPLLPEPPLVQRVRQFLKTPNP